MDILNLNCNGWISPGKDFHIENESKHIFINLEPSSIKRYASFRRKTYIKMLSKLLDDEKAICYIVEPDYEGVKDEIWEFTEGRVLFSQKRIRRISKDKLYDMIFEDSKT